MSLTLASQLSRLTRQLGSISLNQHQPRFARCIGPIVSAVDLSRSFATKNKKKPKNAKAKREQKLKARSQNVASEGKKEGKKDEPALQHQEWIDFQKSIAVEGFETGQIVTPQETKKTRGGKAVRGRLPTMTEVEQRIAERQRLTEAKGGMFPPIRYSDEETERLLAEAYAAVPPRGGKRGTRNMKRQKRRWFLVRKIRKKYKYHMANFQERKMEKRSRKIREVRQALERAPRIRARDRSYQAEVFRRWAENMVQGQGEGGSQDSADGGEKKLQAPHLIE